MKRKERNHTNKSPSLRGGFLFKLSLGWLTTRQSPCMSWDFVQRPIEGALISFSGMKTILALFFSALTFCYFWVKPKVRGMAEGIFTCNQADLRILACNDQTDLGNQL